MNETLGDLELEALGFIESAVTVNSKMREKHFYPRGFDIRVLTGRARGALWLYFTVHADQRRALRALYMKNSGSTEYAGLDPATRTLSLAHVPLRDFFDFLSDPGDPVWLSTLEEWWRTMSFRERMGYYKNSCPWPLNEALCVHIAWGLVGVLQPNVKAEAYVNDRLHSLQRALAYNRSASPSHLEKPTAITAPVPSSDQTESVQSALSRLASRSTVQSMADTAYSTYANYLQLVFTGKDAFDSGPNPYQDLRGKANGAWAVDREKRKYLDLLLQGFHAVDPVPWNGKFALSPDEYNYQLRLVRDNVNNLLRAL